LRRVDIARATHGQPCTSHYSFTLTERHFFPRQGQTTGRRPPLQLPAASS